MHHVHAELDPESGAKVWAAIVAHGRTLTYQLDTDPNGQTHVPQRGESNRYERTNATALIQLVTGSTTLDRRIREVVVIIDHDTLLDRLHQGGGVRNRRRSGFAPLNSATAVL